MRMPRVRFTVRRMMVVVAIVALGLWVQVLRTRRSAFLRVAETHRRQAALLRIDTHGIVPPDWFDRKERLARKYSYAAAHPWLPVEPGPPGPE